jgi:hypothetical protein
VGTWTRWRAIAILAGFGLAGCGGGDTQTPVAPSAPVTNLGLFIVGLPPASLVLGQTIQLRSLVRYSDGTSIDVSGSTSWASTNAAVAPISPDGTLSALAAGSTSISALHAGLGASSNLLVTDTWAADLDFRVAILNATATPKPAHDVSRVFDLAVQILQVRTGARMRIVDTREVGPGSPRDHAEDYLSSVAGLAGGLPDGVLVWAEDENAIGFGGYSTQIAMPAPYANRYPGAAGDNRVYLAAIHWDHKYGRCGYDSTGQVRISDRSANGECRNRTGMVCVDNGRFWECPDVSENLYAQPDVFTASSIVHEFMHPFGGGGNNDHYSTPSCRSRMGMSETAATDLRRSQEFCAMCPDLFLHFRPRASAMVWRGR